MTAGEKLKKIRQHRRMTQQQLSDLTGISVRLLQKYEADVRYPKQENMSKLAEVLRVDARALRNNHLDCVDALLYILVDAEQTFGKLSVEKGEQGYSIHIDNQLVDRALEKWMDFLQSDTEKDLFDWQVSAPFRDTSDFLYFHNGIMFDAVDFGRWLKTQPKPSISEARITVLGETVSKERFEKWLVEQEEERKKKQSRKKTGK